MADWVVQSTSEAQTLDLGIQLGRLLEQPAQILLQGDLGAGKSVLARGIARGLGVDPQVPITSPTFTLMNHYRARLDLYHFDLYRLSGPDELIEIGFDDFAYGNGVALVEWPERLEDESVAGLWVRIRHLQQDRRELVFSAVGDLAEELFQRLREGMRDIC
jgi:tRNA threonylcarbamoyladenosine biosynthesis protein TsaE